jgi:hypothetical protein
MRGTGKQSTGATRSDGSSSGPQRPGLVLTSLILVAAVANLNLAVANVALPTIGTAFGARPRRGGILTRPRCVGEAQGS